MNAIPVPDSIAEQFEQSDGLQRIVVGAPGDGHLDGDGSSPDEAYAIEALVGRDSENGWPMIREYWVPSPEDIELLRQGCPIELVFWMPQMPVHCVQVQPIPVADSQT